MYSAQQQSANPMCSPFSCDPMSKLNYPLSFYPFNRMQTSMNPLLGMTSLESIYQNPAIQFQQGLGFPTGQINYLGRPVQSQIPLNYLTQQRSGYNLGQYQTNPNIPRDELVQCLVDDRRRDLTNDAAVAALLKSLKQYRHADKVIASLVSGEPIQDLQLVRAILADRLKDVQVSEIIEKVISDREFNRKADAVIEKLVYGTTRPDTLWKHYENQAIEHAINHAAKKILIQDQNQGLTTTFKGQQTLPGLQLPQGVQPDLRFAQGVNPWFQGLQSVGQPCSSGIPTFQGLDLDAIGQIYASRVNQFGMVPNPLGQQQSQIPLKSGLNYPSALDFLY